MLTLYTKQYIGGANANPIYKAVYRGVQMLTLYTKQYIGGANANPIYKAVRVQPRCCYVQR